MEENSPIVRFPSFFDKDAYKNRQVIIHVKELNIFDNIDKLINSSMEQSKNGTTNLQEKYVSTAEMLKNASNNTVGDKNAKTIYTIVLPLPNSFSDNQGHSWSTEKGFIGTALGGAESTQLKNIIPGGKTLSEGVQKVGGIAGAIFDAGASMQLQHAIGAAANSMGFRKPLVDPGYFQNYTGSEPRTFDMSFELVPSSSLDAKKIFEIILALKRFSAPSQGPGGVSITAPHYFDINLGNEKLSQLINMQGVVLKNMSIEYGADGFMQFLPDGMPKVIKINLTFVEKRMMLEEDFYPKTPNKVK